MSDAATISVYDRKADDYASLTDAFNTDDPNLRAFIAACPSGARVLDLGCGPGTSAAIMARAGLQVDAVDASAEMVARAATHPGVTARQASFDEMATLPGGYGGVWANFSLLHAPRADFPRHLSDLKSVMLPGAVLHIGMKLGSGEARDAIGRFYSYYSDDELTAYLQKAGFRVHDRSFGSGTGLDGAVSDWIVLRAHA